MLFTLLKSRIAHVKNYKLDYK